MADWIQVRGGYRKSPYGFLLEVHDRGVGHVRLAVYAAGPSREHITHNLLHEEDVHTVFDAKRLAEGWLHTFLLDAYMDLKGIGLVHD